MTAVITGIGVVSPLGVGLDSYRTALSEGRSGVVASDRLDETGAEVRIGAVVRDFAGKDYVQPRKALKLMCPEIQWAYAAAKMAAEDASLTEVIPPDRLGVVFGAEMYYGEMEEMAPSYKGCINDEGFELNRFGAEAQKLLYPLWMLKYLPNMPACHVSIGLDARAHCNSIVSGEVGAILAIAEAIRAIDRGNADALLTGGAGSRLNVGDMIWRGYDRLSHRHSEPERASRPFDRDRDGMVLGQGAAVFTLESASLAKERSAKIYAEVLSIASTAVIGEGVAAKTRAIEQTISAALSSADLSPGDVGHVSASGWSTPDDDIAEAAAINAQLPNVPVIAMKSYFGYTGAASAALQSVASLLALETGELPPTLNYENPDPACPIAIVHGEPQPLRNGVALILGQSQTGQVAAMALRRD